MRALSVASLAVLALVGGTVLLGANGALAHDGHEHAEGLIKKRTENMKAMKTAIKKTGPMITGVMTYDPQAVKEAAETIASYSGDALTRLFPEGSQGAETDALPEIWDEWDRFETQAKDVKKKAEVLAAFSGDQGKAASAFEALGRSCKSCHRAFKD